MSNDYNTKPVEDKSFCELMDQICEPFQGVVGQTVSISELIAGSSLMALGQVREKFGADSQEMRVAQKAYVLRCKVDDAEQAEIKRQNRLTWDD